MRKFGKKMRVGFCRSDIHAAVHLHRIGADDFRHPVKKRETAPRKQCLQQSSLSRSRRCKKNEHRKGGVIAVQS